MTMTMTMMPTTTIFGPPDTHTPKTDNPVMTIASNTLDSTTPLQLPTTHWICKTFTPVLQAMDHHAAAITELSAKIDAAFPSQPSNLDPPFPTKPNLTQQIQNTQAQSHRPHKLCPLMYPPLPPSTQPAQPPLQNLTCQPQLIRLLPISGPQLSSTLIPMPSPT